MSVNCLFFIMAKQTKLLKTKEERLAYIEKAVKRGLKRKQKQEKDMQHLVKSLENDNI